MGKDYCGLWPQTGPFSTQTIGLNWMAHRIEVVRTAFASVCLWHNERFLWLNVHTGKATPFNPRIDIMFDSTLIETNFRKSVLLEPLFQKAVGRFGNLGPDECFGFAPLPALGGAMDEEYIFKTQMREYVGLVGHVLG